MRFGLQPHRVGEGVTFFTDPMFIEIESMTSIVSNVLRSHCCASPNETAWDTQLVAILS